MISDNSGIISKEYFYLETQKFLTGNLLEVSWIESFILIEIPAQTRNHHLKELRFILLEGQVQE